MVSAKVVFKLRLKEARRETCEYLRYMFSKKRHQWRTQPRGRHIRGLLEEEPEGQGGWSRVGHRVGWGEGQRGPQSMWVLVGYGPAGGSHWLRCKCLRGWAGLGILTSLWLPHGKWVRREQSVEGEGMRLFTLAGERRPMLRSWQWVWGRTDGMMWKGYKVKPAW